MFRIETPCPRKVLFAILLQRAVTCTFPSPQRTKRRNGGLKALFPGNGCWQTNKASLVLYPEFLALNLSMYLLEGNLALDHRTLRSWSILWTPVQRETHFRKLRLWICYGNLDLIFEITSWLIIRILELVAKGHCEVSFLGGLVDSSSLPLPSDRSL